MHGAQVDPRGTDLHLRPARPNALPPPADLNPLGALDAANVPTGLPIPTGLLMPIDLFIPIGLPITTGLFTKIRERNPKPNPNRGPMKNGE